MTLAEFSIKNPLICSIGIIISLIGGWLAYENMPRFEDPEFTIRIAKVITQYPGASPEEVMTEVTEVVETAIQELAEVKTVTSESSPGMSDISVEIKFEASPSKGDLQIVWTKLRNKINDIQNNLPPGAGPTIVSDDFGDVYGVYYLLTGEGFTPPELLAYAKELRRDILQVKGVGKVAITGEQAEVIYVEISREKAAALGVSLNNVYNALAQQNTISSAGNLHIGSERLVIQPTGGLSTLVSLRNLIINDPTSGSVMRMKDVATITRGYKDPVEKVIRYDGELALGIGISNVSGVNVVQMGKDIDAKLEEVANLRPIGMELHEYYHQGKVVDVAIKDFAANVVMSLVIVFVTLLIFMGFRSGIVMGATVLITMAATLLIMWLGGIPMHRISLGALVVSLGMLVDNGVVVTDGILVGVQEGRKKLDVAIEVAKSNMKPLVGGTLVGIIAFAPIGFAPGDTAEFTNSLFWVVGIALALSWFFAFTITPLFCYWLFPELKTAQPSSKSAPKGRFISLYEGVIRSALKQKLVSLAIVVGIFAFSMWGFQFVKGGFFPASTSPQIVVDYQLPEGTDISQTTQDMLRLEKYVQGIDGVKHVQTLIGGKTLRYMLTYDAGSNNSADGQLLIKIDDYRKGDVIIPQLQVYMDDNFPSGLGKAWKFRLGPGGGSKIEAVFYGPEAKVLRSLANEAKAIMAADSDAVLIKDDWRRAVSYIEPIYSQSKGERVGITRKEFSDALQSNFSGQQRGVFREGDDLIPIIFRAPEVERARPWSMASIQVLSPTTNKTVPLGQLLEGVNVKWRDGRLLREDRVLTIKAQADPASGVLADDLFNRLKPQIEGIALPAGYNMKWDGEFGSSSEAQSNLATSIPLGFIAMVLVVVILFNRIRQPIIIWAVVPLGLIGVVFGLIITGTPLEFMGLLGLLSLSGLLIQNSLVLVDNTDNLIADGMPRFDALVESAASRLRPVMMGAFTTVLGIIPLYFDAFFKSMTVVLAFGLSFATLITLLITPVLYALFFRIKKTEVAV
ncbi:efflux RND transporter permease subunit [Kordiimonas aquimaris]|uniref:efflux RND transporter permease subunit n=1 Tax=Kordiimonas aquimaris TaxID=707591 RepID=UPI0021D21AE8|nr:efflux RND transporter permease subunit [Kordiimonas aquimaris]